MRTQRQFYPEATLVCACELENCLICAGRIKVAYYSGKKIVQTLQGAFETIHVPKHCLDPDCAAYLANWQSSSWLQIAPRFCTYGYDVITQIGWLRQDGKEQFAAIRDNLSERVKISETQVRNLYHERYLPLLACSERQSRDQLLAIAARTGIILSLDGLAPEGGEPQLWVVRELLSGLTLRSGWLAKQDENTFVNFLQPIAELGLPIKAVLSDKQRGLVPAVAHVFPDTKHSFCQIHYLQNAAIPIAEADEAMKVALRQGVRETIGEVIRAEKVENGGVLTVTGILPSPAPQAPISSDLPQAREQEDEHIRQDMKRSIRYLLTLKGRPPFRLAGLEMFERLSQVQDCLEQLLALHPDPELDQLRQGLQIALQAAQAEYTILRQAANWLEKISDLLDPQGKPHRKAAQVQQELSDYLKEIQIQSSESPRLQTFYKVIEKTTRSYASGLFHSYDIPGLPRTNNDRESEFRDLNRRLLSTTGQKGLVRRILQRTGAWELVPRPVSLDETMEVLSKVDENEFLQERQRLREHRQRFRLHTRSARQSQAQFKRITQQWLNLHPSPNL
ncbi:MAG: transposase [Euryarchaeota archaeon]|nr:transposase [Euryarchaeota archaeon]MCG2785159.1 transposase [Anaerolineae bacterium]